MLNKLINDCITDLFICLLAVCRSVQSTTKRVRFGPGKVSIKVEGIEEDRKAVFRRTHSTGARFLMSNAIQLSSSETYKNHWKNWTNFMKMWVETEDLQDSDLFLIRPGGTELDMLSMRTQVETCAAYCHYAVTVLKHKPNTIVGTLSGVRHWFRTNGLSLDVFDNPSLLAAKTGLALAQRRIEVDSEMSRSSRDKKRVYPATLHMVEDIATDLKRSGTMKSMMVATAVQIAFFCLLRVSEYVPHANKRDRIHKCHAMKGKDVEFEIMKNGRISTVKSADIKPEMWPLVTLVRFELRHSKNDKMRTGSVFWFRNLPSEGGINIVKTVFDWVCLSRPGPESYLMSYRSQKDDAVCLLRYSDVARVVKAAAMNYGFEARFFSTHSLRVGGACLLRAGSAPDSLIQLLGRWKSLVTCLGYQESSMREFDAMQSIMRNRNLFTAKDVRLFHHKAD